MAHAERVLIELVNKISAERKYDEPLVKINPIISTGDNFTSQLFGITISGNNKLQLNIFAKLAVIGEKIRKQGLETIFEAEQYFYTKIKKIYRDLEDKHNVPMEHRLQIPAYYGSNETKYEEAIFLEDLTASGFQVRDRLKELDWEFAATATTEMAKLHALGFAYAAEDPKDFEESCKTLKAKFTNDDHMKVLWKNIADRAIAATSEEHKEWMRQFLANYDLDIFVECTTTLRRPVLSHNDYRVSNLMEKVDERGRMQVRIVDYQTIRGASPVVDLLYFIFSGTDEKFRKLYYDQLLDHYYNELSLAMKRLDLNPDEIYTRTDFDFEYKTKLPFGLSIAVLILPVVTIDADNAPKVNENTNMSDLIMDNTSDLFSERLNGIISDYIRWGVL